MSEFGEVRARIEAAREAWLRAVLPPEGYEWQDTDVVLAGQSTLSLSAALLAILDLHQRREGEGFSCPWCPHDGQPWPCATVRRIQASFGLDRSKEQHHE